MYISSFKEFQSTLNDIANSLAESGISLDGCTICSYPEYEDRTHEFFIMTNGIKIAEFSCGYFRTI